MSYRETAAIPTPDTQPDRLTIALIPKVADDLAALRKRSGLSKTDLVNRAITLYEFTDAQIAAGGEVLVRAGDGTVQAVKFL